MAPLIENLGKTAVLPMITHLNRGVKIYQWDLSQPLSGHMLPVVASPNFYLALTFQVCNGIKRLREYNVPTGRRAMKFQQNFTSVFLSSHSAPVQKERPETASGTSEL